MTSIINTQSILDEHKEKMPEGVYLELSNSLMKAFAEDYGRAERKSSFIADDPDIEEEETLIPDWFREMREEISPRQTIVDYYFLYQERDTLEEDSTWVRTRLHELEKEITELNITHTNNIKNKVNTKNAYINDLETVIDILENRLRNKKDDYKEEDDEDEEEEKTETMKTHRREDGKKMLECSCGSVILWTSYKRHLTTQKHKTDALYKS